ncbi:MAG: DUF3240 family protein [Gammaproteobacteria bacterium]
MINLTLLADASVKQSLADALRALPDVERFIFTNVEEHSHQLEHDPLLSERDKVVGYVPRVRVDILLEESALDVVRNALGAPGCGLAGRCRYWVTPVGDISEI